MSKIPTLTSAGWVSDVVTTSNTLLDYFLVSEDSQSQLYKGLISSLPSLIQKYGNEPNTLETMAQQQLKNFFSQYQSDVQVNVNSTNTNDPSGRYNLDIDIVFIKDDVQYSLGRLIEIGDSKIINVTSR